MAETDEKIQGYRNPGDIEVKQMIFVSPQGQVIDISSIVTEFNLFQSIFDTFLKCEVTINDSVGLIDSLVGADGYAGGFTGSEVIVVSYKTKDDEFEFRNHAFGLHQLENRQRVSEKSEAYLMHGCSVEYYNTIQRKLSRAYGGTSGNQISSMVKSIVDEFMGGTTFEAFYNDLKGKTGVRVTKTNRYDQSNGLQRFIVPNVTVNDALDMLAVEADCDGHVPYYIFFENADGFQFRDINTLLKEGGDAPKNTYTYEPSNYKDVEQENATAEFKDPFKIINFSMDNEQEQLENIEQGLFASKTINIDIMKKTTSTVNFDYNKEVSKFNTLQRLPIAGTANPEANINLTTSRSGQDADPFFADEGVLPKRINQFISKKRSFFAHNFNTTMTATIHGDSDLQAGDVIELRIPVGTNLNDTDGQDDKYLSGKYLIASLRHSFSGKTGSQFTTVLELAKSTGNE